MPRILHIETSGEICSVALSEKDQLIGQKESEEQRSHASMLTLLIDEMMKEAGIGFPMLDAVAVSKGPGSYTGLRIGVSAAKGICFAHDLPLIGINTLEALASGILEKEKSKLEYLGFGNEDYVCPLIDARRMEVYTAIYNSTGREVKGPHALILKEGIFEDILQLKRILFLGSGAEKASEMIRHPNAIFLYRVNPLAEFMVHLASKAFEEKHFEDVAYFEPYYLKDFIATTPRKNMLGKP